MTTLWSFSYNSFVKLSLYNTPYYNTDMDKTLSCGGSHILFTMEFYKGIIGKLPYGHFPIIPL